MTTKKTTATKKTTRPSTSRPGTGKQVYVLLDRSYSMEGAWDDTLAGINSFVTEVGDAEVTLATFDSDGYDVVRRRTSARDWRPVTREDAFPRGGTPLLDAAGRMIWTMMDDEPDRAVLVIVTDGAENASVKFKKHEIQAYVSEIVRSEDRDVVFLGANFDRVSDVASYTGLTDATRSMSYSGLAGTRSAFTSTASSSSGFLDGQNKATSFYSDVDRASAKASGTSSK